MAARSRPSKILAVDWDARTLRVVHALLTKRGVSIDRLLSIAIPADVDPATPQRMGGFIRRVLDQEGIHTKHAIVDVPRDQAILNTLTLPTGAPDELPGMVQIQIAKELPFPVSQAAVDYAAESAETDTATSEVLVAAIRREVLEQYVEIFTVAGLRLDRVGLRPYANKTAVCELLKHGMPERVLCLDIRPTLTEINVLRSSVLVFSRAASVAMPTDKSSRDASAQGETESGLALVDDHEASGTREAAIQSLLVELTRSIEAYRASDPGAVIDHVVIAGDLGVEEVLAETVQRRLDITTEIYNPATTFGWTPDEGAGASAFSASLGLVLGHADPTSRHFDFLHPKEAVSATQERLRKAPLVAVVTLLFLATLVVVGYDLTKDDRKTLADIKTRIAELESHKKENTKFLKLMDEIRAFDEQHVWVDVLHDVVSCLPSHEELVVNRMDLNQKEGRVVLKTVAKQRDTATTAIRTLEEFRRPGNENPRFRASMGTQSEKHGQRYPFVQDLRISILSDKKEKHGARGDRSQRRRG